MSTRTKMNPYPRHRQEKSYSRPGSVSTIVKYSGTPGVYTTTTEQRLGGVRGTARRTSDIVTPGFKELVASGSVINNPYSSLKYTMDWGGTGALVRRVARLTPWPAGSNFTIDNVTWQLNQNPAFVLEPFVDSLGNLANSPSIYTGRESLLTRAKTDALANVDQSIALGLVGLGELKKTLHGLINPLQAINSYLNRWKLKPTKRGYKLYLDDGTGLINAVSSQYLSLYYGLKPFLMDIESYIDAYVNSEAQHERKTARGRASGSKVEKTYAVGNRNGYDTSWFDATFTRTEEVVVRSGVLYRPSPMSIRKAYGVRLGDVIPSIYELVPWSFFIDYFSNLGSLIEALTPRQGVQYLAAWDTVVTTHTWEARTTASGIGPNYRHDRVSTEWATRVLESRERSPTGVYANIGLVGTTGVWESKAKVAAVLSLLLQNLGPKIIPSGLWKA